MSRIEVEVGVRNAPFRSGLDEMRGAARQFSGEIKGMFAGAFAVGALISGIQNVINKGDEVGDLAVRFRVSSEELQRLGMAAELSGTSMETVARSMNKMRLAQANAVNGNEELRETFAAMGISVEQLAGMGTEELYYRVADAVAGAGSETHKLEIASAVFGQRMAGELIPMLEQGGDRMRALGGSAAVMSDEIIGNLSEAKDEITKLQQTLTVIFGTVIGTVLMPFINAVKTLGAAYGGYMFFMMELTGEFAGILAQAFNGDFSGAYDRVKRLGGFMQQTFQNAAEGVKQTVGEIWQEPTNPEPSQGKDNSSADVDASAAKEAAALEKQLADEREKNARAMMDRQAKINALQAEYNALVTDAQKLSGNEKTKKLIEAEKVRGELDREKKSQTEDEIRDRDRIEKEAGREAEARQKEKERQAEELKRAKTDEASVDEENQMSDMTPEEKREHLRQKQSQLLSEAQAATESGDELAATQKRTEAKRMQSQIDSLTKESSKPEQSRGVLTVDSLQRVAGGGGIGNVVDPAQRERERHTALLERIAQAVEERENGRVPLTATLGP